MTDVLYTLGPDSGHDNQELRWSLRSVAMFGRNVGRVIVAGYPPDWLSDEVVRFPVERPEGLRKDAVIFHNVMSAIDAGVVSWTFLLSSDDHFLTAPCDFDATPLWAREKDGAPVSIPPYANGRGGNDYRLVLDQTRRVLLAAGYGIAKTNPHRNTVIDYRLAPELKRLRDAAPDKSVGIEINCAMGNLRHDVMGVPFRLMKDWKVRHLRTDAVAAGAFSIRDAAFDDPAFVAYMGSLFREPCVYERKDMQ